METRNYGNYTAIDEKVRKQGITDIMHSLTLRTVAVGFVRADLLPDSSFCLPISSAS